MGNPPSGAVHASGDPGRTFSTRIEFGPLRVRFLKIEANAERKKIVVTGRTIKMYHTNCRLRGANYNALRPYINGRLAAQITHATKCSGVSARALGERLRGTLHGSRKLILSRELWGTDEGTTPKVYGSVVRSAALDRGRALPVYPR